MYEPLAALHVYHVSVLCLWGPLICRNRTASVGVPSLNMGAWSVAALSLSARTPCLYGPLVCRNCKASTGALVCRGP